MKKLISIILLALTLCLVGCEKVYSLRKKDAIDKCKAEFVFDYDEEILLDAKDYDRIKELLEK